MRSDDLFSSGPTVGERLPLAGADVRFIPAFYDTGMATRLFQTLVSSSPWQAMEISIWGKRVLQPRLICWYGDPGASYKYSGLKLEPLYWTEALANVRSLVESATEAKFNSVLLNLYRNQNDSMGWHSDNEPELGERPTIASLSLGETRTFLFKNKSQKDMRPVSVELNSGSLLVMAGDTQKNWQHAIKKEMAALGPRVNLTFRNVVGKVSRAK